MKYDELTLGQIEATVEKLGGMNGLRRFLSNELLIIERNPEVTNPRAPVDTTVIQVDRDIRPKYPDWMKEPIHAEFEAAGPAEYDLASVELWLHYDQTNAAVTGNCIYEHLKRKDMLRNCLGLRDGEEIQKKGIPVFRKFFEGKRVYLWKSIILFRDNVLGVPCLVERGDAVEVHWDWLDYRYYENSPAAYFPG